MGGWRSGEGGGGAEEKNYVLRGAEGATHFFAKNAFFMNKLHFHKEKTPIFKPAPSAPAKTIELPPVMVEGSRYVATLR